MELELSKNGEIVEQILCITGSHTLTGHRAIVAHKYQLIMLNKQFAFIKNDRVYKFLHVQL